MLDSPVQADPDQIAANGMPGPYFNVTFDFVLVPDTWSVSQS